MASPWRIKRKKDACEYERIIIGLKGWTEPGWYGSMVER